MASDFDKQQWQAEELAREAAIEKQREKERKTRERAARNAKRKLERLERTLKESGDISEFEAEFSESVSDRLERYGAAFQDREKGRPGDALSFAQKRVVAGMNRKVKDLKKAAKQSNNETDELTRPRYSPRKRRSSFKSKKPHFTPRVRQLDDAFDEALEPEKDVEDRPPRPPVGKPFLRIVGKKDEA